MGYLTVKQFAKKWGITERRVVKLCKEGRIDGAIKNGMVWEIPEETLKPSDKRSNIYQYIVTQKRIMIVNVEEKWKEILTKLLRKEGYIVDFKEEGKVERYYEGLIYFSRHPIKKEEEKWISNFAKEKMHSETSIVIVENKTKIRNEIEKNLANSLKSKIGLRINTLLVDMPENQAYLIDNEAIAEDIIELLVKFKNTTGTVISTDGGRIDFSAKGRTKDLEMGRFYRVLNSCFRSLTKQSYLWCASTMLEDEWTETPQEMNFRLINLEVANRGAKVERIFIFSQEKIKQFRTNKTLKIYMQSNIETLFVDYDEIKQEEPDLLKTVADGWDGIDKSLLIVDLPETSEERGYISKDTKEVLKAYECFQELKKYAKSLKEVLK